MEVVGRNVRLLAVALAAVLVVAGCPADDQEDSPETAPNAVRKQPTAEEIASFQLSPAIEQPQTPAVPQATLAYGGGRLLYGAYALEQYAAHNATADRHYLKLRPVAREDGAIDPAWAIFSFDMRGYAGSAELLLEWTGQAPADSELHVGLYDHAASGWNWYAVTHSAADPGGLAPYIGPNDQLLLTVALNGSEPAVLSSVSIGEPWVHASVDLTRLLAPPMGFELQAVRDEWDLRDIKGEGFTIVGEAEEDDGGTLMVVSHRVGGLLNYGGIRIPPHAEGEQLPLMMLCHPGEGHVALAGGMWLESVTGREFLDRFIVLIPAYRGEMLMAGGLGRFRCEGEQSMYDHDADDAIALIESVCANLPQADADNVFTVGYSSGGQIALRIAQRSPRVTGAIAIAGFTDEWTTSNQAVFPGRLDKYVTEPPAGDAYHHMIWELRNGRTDVWKARQVLLRASVAHFADLLPPVQVHHGAKDAVLPITHGQRLDGVLSVIDGTGHEFYAYEDGTHGLGSLTGMGARITAFVDGLLVQ